jgi:hypothetical protein
MAGIWDKFSEQYDPQMVGLSLLSSVGQPNTGQNLGTALLMGRQARMDEAMQRANDAAAKRQEQIDLAKGGLEETAGGQFRKAQSTEVKVSPTGGIYSVSQGGDLTQPKVDTLYQPQEKPQAPQSPWRQYADPVNGQQGLYNEITGEFKAIGAASGPMASGGIGGGAGGSKAERQAIQTAVGASGEMGNLRSIITNKEMMQDLGGPVDAAAAFVESRTGADTPRSRARAFLVSGIGDQVLQEVSKLAPATQQDVQNILNWQAPPPAAGQGAWVDWYNKRARALTSTLSRNAPELLDDPSVAQWATPISEEEAGLAPRKAPSGGFRIID